MPHRWLKGQDKKQKTDVHYRSLNGEGNFNKGLKSDLLYHNSFHSPSNALLYSEGEDDLIGLNGIKFCIACAIASSDDLLAIASSSASLSCGMDAAEVGSIDEKGYATTFAEAG